MLYEPAFLKKNSFSSLNLPLLQAGSLFFSLSEPQILDFQSKINFKQALKQIKLFYSMNSLQLNY